MAGISLCLQWVTSMMSPTQKPYIQLFFFSCPCILSNLWIINWFPRQRILDSLDEANISNPSSWQFHFSLQTNKLSLACGFTFHFFVERDSMCLCCDLNKFWFFYQIKFLGQQVVAYPTSYDSTKGNVSWSELW